MPYFTMSSNSTGLSPDVLQGVIQPPSQGNDKGKKKEDLSQDSQFIPHPPGSRVIYEFADVVDHVEPRLHLYLDGADGLPSYSTDATLMRSSRLNIPFPISQHILQFALPPSAQVTDTLNSLELDSHSRTEDLASYALSFLRLLNSR